MQAYDFIFSDKLSHRVLRHGIFWIIFLFYFYYVNFFPSKPEDLRNIKTYSDAFELLIFFPISFISVYVTIYFLLPVYILTSRYIAFTFALVAFTVINFSIAYLLTILLANLITNTPFNQLPVTFRWFLPVRYGIGLPLTSAALTAIIKLLKTWHLKQKENEQLLQQKVKNEIQLLKSHFQPLFLYNTLKEISLLLLKNPGSVPATLLKLSELLSYLLHEVEKDEVPLKQEIEMMKNFLSLKKTFRGSKLVLKFQQQGEMERRRIAPLLLVSLLENFFTEVVEPSSEAVTITIVIKVDKDEFYFSLKCQRDNGNEFIEENENDWAGASLKKIKLLYPYLHRIETYAENDTTSLTLILEKLTNKKETEKAQDSIAIQYEPA